ncbi:MAG: hypothetical protein ABSF53_16320, partial [Terracidiphilus sp.]
MSKPEKRCIHPQLPFRNRTSSRRRFRTLAVYCAAWIAISFAAVSVLPAQTAEQDETSEVRPDVSSLISPDLDRHEQAVIHASLSNLPLSIQQHLVAKPKGSVHVVIVDGRTGSIHYSRPEDAGSFEVRPNPGMPGDDDPFLTEDDGLDPGVYAGSGPYRRVYTKPMPAVAQPTPTGAPDVNQQHFYVAQGDVSIICKAGKFATGDVGYSYMGGWSGTWNQLSGPEGQGRAIDAGLQYSPTMDNYAMIMSIAGLGEITIGNYKTASTPQRIQCTEKADLADVKFYAFGAYQTPTAAPSCWYIDDSQHIENFIGFPDEDCNTYGLGLEVTSDQFLGKIKGITTYYLMYYSPDYKYGGWGTLTPYTAKFYNGSENVAGWLPRVPCENCAFKWMTSMAQTKERLTDGSWYATAW